MEPEATATAVAEQKEKPIPALPPATPERLAGKDQEFKLLAIEKVHPSKTNPRKTFDKDGLEKLAASIRETGIHQPLVVRPEGSEFEIVAGERRWRAAKMAGLDKIPCMVRDLTDEQAMEVQLIENLQREDVHPLEEGEGYRALLDTKKYTVESIAKKIGSSKKGVSVGYVYAKLKLAALAPKVKEAFLARKIEETHALQLARLDPASQLEALDICRAELEEDDNGPGGSFLISSRDLQDWIHTHIYMELGKAPFDRADAELLPKAGPCATCPKKAGNSPDLFSDVVKKETCTDRSCFKEKLDAWLERRRKEIEAKGRDCVLISEQWSEPAKGLLARQKYQEIESGAEPCEKTVKGLVGEGSKFGKDFLVCLRRNECKKPGHGLVSLPRKGKGGGSPKKAAAAEKRRQQEEESRRNREKVRDRAVNIARVEILGEILKKTKGLTRQDLELLALCTQGTPYLHEAPDPEWMPKDLSNWKAVGKASDVELARFLVASSMDGEFSSRSPGTNLLKTAKRHRINVAAIEKRAAVQAKNEAAHKAQQKRWKGLAASSSPSHALPTCKDCGCMETAPCPGGCKWVKLDKNTNVGVCSACEGALKRR